MNIFLSALMIFALRVVDVSFAVLRIMIVMRGQKAMAWVMGFFQALVFVVAIRQVLADLSNWTNMIGYAAGFATGTVVGMWIEGWLAVGYGHVRIISSRHGVALEEKLRGAGFAVTQIAGRGKDGTVDILTCSVPRKQVATLRKFVIEADPEAFITIENVRPLWKGFFRN